MLTTDDRKKALSRADSADPWADWKPGWQGRAETPHDRQERHSPTAPVTLRGEKSSAARRRITDARLWDAMSPAMQDAALEIAAVFEAMGRGLGFAASDWTRVRGGGQANAADVQAALFSAYVGWTKRCHKAGVSHSMIIDILVYGFTCRALDRDRRAANGWSRQNLLRGLALYCDVKGWPS